MRDYYAKCHACETEWLTSVPASVFVAHEQTHHDGAQTVWTAAQEAQATGLHRRAAAAYLGLDLPSTVIPDDPFGDLPGSGDLG